MKTKIVQTIPRHVWVLGFVSLLTDISSKMTYSVLPLFLVLTLGANLLTVGLIEGIAGFALLPVMPWLLIQLIQITLSTAYGLRQSLDTIGAFLGLLAAFVLMF